MTAVMIGMVTCHMQRASVRGRKFFLSKCISWSYQKCGYDVRIHRNDIVSNRVLIVKLVVHSSGVVGLLYAPRNDSY